MRDLEISVTYWYEVNDDQILEAFPAELAEYREKYLARFPTVGDDDVVHDFLVQAIGELLIAPGRETDHLNRGFVKLVSEDADWLLFGRTVS